MAPNLQEITESQLSDAHKVERKALATEIAALKKSMTKKNKKTIQSQISELNSKLNSRLQKEVHEWRVLHKDEIEEAEKAKEAEAQELTESMSNHSIRNDADDTTEENTIDTPQLPAETAPPAKRNRQKERLAKRNAKLQQIRDEALEESKNSVDYRQLEIQQMDSKLEERDLFVVDILPDGNCLFNSIKDQLSHHLNIHKTVQDLRQEAAQYITSHPDDFQPFLFEKSINYTLQDYCDKLVNDTMWGSDIEILAFSKVYDCVIEVFIADCPNMVFNEGKDSVLTVGFYKHSYGLGEHYNSLKAD